jgi:hypothetical protein
MMMSTARIRRAVYFDYQRHIVASLSKNRNRQSQINSWESVAEDGRPSSIVAPADPAVQGVGPLTLMQAGGRARRASARGSLRACYRLFAAFRSVE